MYSLNECFCTLNLTTDLLQAANKTLDNTLVLTQPNIKQFLELYQPFKIASENSLKKMVALCTDRQKKKQ
jgi:hypothetical protein